VSAIAAKVDPGLVDINTTLKYQGEEGAGTGMVLTSTGLVLTNNHVIDGETSISVTDIGNGKTYSATVVGYDRTQDVALIQLSGASDLKTVTTSSATAAKGEAVVGIGNAGGAGGTPSVAGGSVTALDRSITASDAGDGTSEQLSGLIQTDADIQPGDSGGPLVNSAGQVLGMDTAASENFSFSNGGGQGYAIPISQALSIASEIEHGSSSSLVHIGETAFLGVDVETNTGTGSGVLIAQALSGTPAAKAGFGEGDVITSVDGTSVTSPAALTAVLGRYHPGNTVSIGWTDTAGAHRTTTVTLASGPPA
jgi:S1-C subfamily serine protease